MKNEHHYRVTCTCSRSMIYTVPSRAALDAALSSLTVCPMGSSHTTFPTALDSSRVEEVLLCSRCNVVTDGLFTIRLAPYCSDCFWEIRTEAADLAREFHMDHD